MTFSLKKANFKKRKHDLNSRYTTRIGDLDLFSDQDGANPVEILIAERIIHNGYNPTTFVNDIAILRLETPVKYTSECKNDRKESFYLRKRKYK